MPPRPSTLLLSHIAHRERVDYLPPAYVDGLVRQHSASLPLSRLSMMASELSMAQALRKRTKISRLLRSSTASKEIPSNPRTDREAAPRVASEGE